MTATWRILEGDCRTMLRTLPERSVQTCVTSPPYFGLRDYGHDGQIGLEPTPDEFVQAMVGVFREVRPVLRDDGTVWLNLGDSYNNRAVNRPSSHQAGLGFESDHLATSWRDHAANGRARMSITDGDLKEKDLLGVPWAVAQALRAPYYAGRITAERDRVWLAATLDAEGCITGFTHERADGDGTRTGVHITITNTSRLLLDQAHRIWPAARVEHENHGDGHLGRRPSWRWLPTSAADKALLMRELYPYMIVKREQARLAYALAALSIDAKRLGHSPQRDVVREKRAWIVDALSRLNQGEGVDIPAWVGEPPSVLEPGWYLRSDIIWSKPNPMPESVTDRPTKAHEYVFLLSKGPRYFYDADSIREAHLTADDGRNREDYEPKRMQPVPMPDADHQRIRTSGASTWPEGGRNKRSVWTVATQPYPGAHFATFPAKLIEPCILAGCPERACSVCGVPWTRIVERERQRDGASPRIDGRDDATAGNSAIASLPAAARTDPSRSGMGTPTSRTLGWEPSCAHDVSSTPGTVLDPFAGAGTTGVVALRHNRSFIGIELNPEYVELARDRIIGDAPLLNSVAEAA